MASGTLDTHEEGHDHGLLAHHFDSLDQQYASAKLGMWIFLVTEILLFGGLFVAYIVYRALHPEVFMGASKYLEVSKGALNTVVLIFSSLTMALAVRAAMLGNRRQQLIMLSITLACAAVFMVVKYFEYTHKFHLGLAPGKFYAPAESFQEQFPYARNFFSIYFCMTGLHGFHVLVGMGLIGWLIVRAAKGHFHSQNFTAVEIVGLYWHLVDLIWIYLFPLLYLIH